MFALLLGSVFALIALAAPSNAAYTPKITINSPVCTSGTVTGSGFQPNEAVTLTVSGTTVGSAKTDSTGNFTTTATFPSSITGNKVLTGTGAGGDTASTQVKVNTDCGIAGQSSSRANPSSSSSSGTQGLSATGVAVWTIGGLGVLLLAAGALFTFGGRRGRRA
ncbi:MAG TPA: hypothetical protein VGN18_14510 [Jatrophihabitans sp.]|uniref:hypothetical protein n=1 Tax=Jatrophihabitans sp. TaxID=1932789 RepID=UPI002E003672|nr:hypothetical protein [Jatrophihabitans sp.]